MNVMTIITNYEKNIEIIFSSYLLNFCDIWNDMLVDVNYYSKQNILHHVVRTSWSRNPQQD
jgi:hypothetical protein